MTRMKESGIDWIGQIPEEWEVTRIKNIVSIERGASPRPIDKFISDDDTGVNWIRIGDTYKGNKYITSTKLKITNRGKQFSRYIHPGTLILSNSMSFGEPYISSIYGCIHDGWLSLAPYKNISKEYLYWLLLSDVCTSQFNLVSIGAVVENLSVDKVGNTLVSMPYSLSEQQKIADYLDKKIAQLDKAKALLEEQIQKLKDYRASLIYETVTKGLDKTVPMKDSGIDWIGQVPEGWKIGRVKDAFKLRSEKNFRPIEEVQLLSLYTEFGVFPHGDREEKGNKAVSTEGYKIVYKKDIVVNIILAWMGSIGISEYDGVTSPAYDIYEPLEGVCSKFFHYLFRTEAFAGQCYKYGKGIMKMRWRTYSDDFKTIEIPIPDYNSQVNIVKFLDNKLKIINQLIDIKQEQIENINKQRQTLIYDYVTGKRRV